MTNKETVRQKIIAAVPEILELKFGCEIFRKGATKREFFVGDFADQFSIVRVDDAGAWLPFILPKPPESQQYEILGRPIQLADVLRAYESTEIEYKSQQERIDKAILPLVKLIGIWNLSLPYDDQDEKVYDFLATIL